jgi:nucleoside 2-deoxyribosyltransferase
MAAPRKPTLYLAGPEVFRPDPLAYAATQRALCEQYGFTPLHPVDNAPGGAAPSAAALLRLYDAVKLYRTDPRPALTALPSEGMRCAMQIYLDNIRYVRACDIVVANCNAFRGALVDDGTAYELGLGHGLGKPTYGYLATLLPAVQNVVQRYPCTLQADGVPIDQDGYLVIENLRAVLRTVYALFAGISIPAY